MADNIIHMQQRLDAEIEEGGFTDTDIANGRRLATRHGQDLRYAPERGWYVWDGARWAFDEGTLQVLIRAKDTAEAIYNEIRIASQRDEMYRHARKSQSRKSIEAMIWLARSEAGIPMHITDFDTDGYMFNVQNGTLNLKTGQLQPHRREDLISSVAGTYFDHTAEAELWDAFLWRVTDKNEELYGYLRRLVGYLLVGDVREQTLHFLHGDGSNGKSVFCELLTALLGDYALVASPDLIMLKKHGGIPNDVARLRGVRLAQMNETSQGARFDEAKLKDLTGSDSLSARFLHKEFFDFEPTHRLLIRGNHKPAISGTDAGIWRRLRLVPFLVTIPEAERDLGLLAKLKSELPGILAWAMAGCLEWQREGLKPPQIILAAVEKYRQDSDTLGQFIAEKCTTKKLAQVKSNVLMTAYRDFAEARGERPMPAKDLKDDMHKRGFEHKKINIGQIYEGLEMNLPPSRQEGSDAF
jgi:putative DNA primase/helicase